MKKNWIKVCLALLTAATLLSGCGIEGYRIEVSEDTESSDDDSFDDESFDDDESSDDEPSNDDEFSDSAESFGSTESSSVLEGVWYAFDIVKRNEDTPQKVVFEQSMVFNEDPVQPSKKYQYDEGGQMLEVDYTEYIDYINDLMQTADEDTKFQLEEARQKVESQYPDGVARFYAPLYDSMLFLYIDASNQITEESWEYGSPDFPNTILALPKDGRYYELVGVLCRDPEFPSVKSLSLALGYETIENCLASYYSGYPGVFSYGLLERVYGITDCDINDAFDMVGDEEMDSNVVERDHLSMDNVEDVPREDPVWEYYQDCPLEEVKYVTYSYDTVSGRQTAGLYLGKTYGLWTVIWVSGDI